MADPRLTISVGLDPSAAARELKSFYSSFASQQRTALAEVSRVKADAAREDLRLTTTTVRQQVMQDEARLRSALRVDEQRGRSAARVAAQEQTIATQRAKTLKEEAAALRETETANLRVAQAALAAARANEIAGREEAKRKSGTLAVAARGAVMGLASNAANKGVAIAENLLGDSRKLQTDLMEIRANTELTTAEFEGMRETALRVGADTGAAFKDISSGFMRAKNFGFDYTASLRILDVATKSAVGSSANLERTTELLASTMHNFGLGDNKALETMNLLHQSALLGNMTLEQFVSAAKPTLSVAAQLGVSLKDALSAFVALTKAGYNSSEAATQIRAMLTHIINPTKQAKDEIALLAKATGVDLTRDFSLAGLQAKGLTGVLIDIRKATLGHEDATLKLMNATRGGLGTMLLAGKGFEDLKAAEENLNEVTAGKLDPTTRNFILQQNTLEAAEGRLHNTLLALANESGPSFLTFLTKAANEGRDLLHLTRDLYELMARKVPEGGFIGGFADVITTAVGVLKKGYRDIKEAAQLGASEAKNDLTLQGRMANANSDVGLFGDALKKTDLPFDDDVVRRLESSYGVRSDGRNMETWSRAERQRVLQEAQSQAMIKRLSLGAEWRQSLLQPFTMDFDPLGEINKLSAIAPGSGKPLPDSDASAKAESAAKKAAKDAADAAEEAANRRKKIVSDHYSDLLTLFEEEGGNNLRARLKAMSDVLVIEEKEVAQVKADADKSAKGREELATAKYEADRHGVERLRALDKAQASAVGKMMSRGVGAIQAGAEHIAGIGVENGQNPEHGAYVIAGWADAIEKGFRKEQEYQSDVSDVLSTVTSGGQAAMSEAQQQQLRRANLAMLSAARSGKQRDLSGAFDAYDASLIGPNGQEGIRSNLSAIEQMSQMPGSRLGSQEAAPLVLRRLGELRDTAYQLQDTDLIQQLDAAIEKWKAAMKSSGELFAGSAIDNLTREGQNVFSNLFKGPKALDGALRNAPMALLEGAQRDIGQEIGDRFARSAKAKLASFFADTKGGFSDLFRGAQLSAERIAALGFGMVSAIQALAGKKGGQSLLGGALGAVAGAFIPGIGPLVGFGIGANLADGNLGGAISSAVGSSAFGSLSASRPGGGGSGYGDYGNFQVATGKSQKTPSGETLIFEYNHTGDNYHEADGKHQAQVVVNTWRDALGRRGG